jgi:hypothetical protein
MQVAVTLHVLDAGVQTIGVGLGSARAGAQFAKQTHFPEAMLFADPKSACHVTMGFSPGFMGSSDLNGYLKIVPMLAGIGSPGTMQVCPRVVRLARITSICDMC